MKDKRKQQVCDQNNGGISAFVCDFSFTWTCFIWNIELFLIVLIEYIFLPIIYLLLFFITVLRNPSRVDEENAGEKTQYELI